MEQRLPFITLILMISFASVNAVLFTPGLPNIAQFFVIDTLTAQNTITVYMLGYALGQLIYGPLANCWGRKAALYIGILIQILSSIVCISTGYWHYYALFPWARFTTALGAAVGLKMTYTLVNEVYAPKKASQVISYLMLAFAITPGLGIAIGGYLNAHWGWVSCFYATALYGVILLVLVTRLPETKKQVDSDSLHISNLLTKYMQQLKNRTLMLSSIIMGLATTYVYLFAAVAPFIAIELLDMGSQSYGIANCIPAMGLMCGSLVNARLIQRNSLLKSIIIGLLITALGSLSLYFGLFFSDNPAIYLFVSMAIVYFGLSLILPNVSVIAVQSAEDKSYGAGVMSFLNMGLATLLVATFSKMTLSLSLLPLCYIALTVGILTVLSGLLKNTLILRVINN